MVLTPKPRHPAVLCDTIRASVEPILADLKPPGLTGIELGRLTLGKK